MNETLATTRTPEIIAAEVKAYSISMLTNVLEIGRRFKEAKSLLPHGEFGTWLKDQCGYSKSTANNFMRLFEEYGERQSSLFGTGVEVQTFGNLGYSQALELLALPAGEREEFVKTRDMESMSVRQLKDEVAAWKTKAETAEGERNTAEARIYELENQVKEFENRPVDVAVAEPDTAVIEDAVNKALAEAQATHDKELQSVKNQFAQKQRELDAALAAKSDAEKAAKKAEKVMKEAVSQRNAEVARAEKADRRAVDAEKNAGGEAEKLRAEFEKAQREVTDLKKQLAMSGEAMVQFKERFFQWQTDWGKMREALFKLDDATVDKSKQAVAAQIKRWAAEMEIRIE